MGCYKPDTVLVLMRSRLRRGHLSSCFYSIGFVSWVGLIRASLELIPCVHIIEGVGKMTVLSPVTNLKKLVFVVGVLAATAGCSTDQNELVNSRGGASKISSVTMPIPDKLKSYMGVGKIDAWSLSVIGGECANGAQSVSHKEKFGVFKDSNVLISEKINSGCAYTFVLSLGKANADKSKLEAVYLTNDLDGKRTELSKEKTKEGKVPVSVTLYFTADGEKVFGVASDSSLSPTSDPTPSPTPVPNPSPIPGQGSSSDATCYKGDERICKIEFLIAQKTNAYRRGQGLSDLGYDPKVAFVSRDWSSKQAASGRIGHSGFPSSRVAVYQQEFGSSLFFTAENVAYNSCDSSESEESVASTFVQQWWNSSGHRQNMLGSHAAIGVGVVINSNGGCYGTQLFR